MDYTMYSYRINSQSVPNPTFLGIDLPRLDGLGSALLMLAEMHSSPLFRPRLELNGDVSLMSF